MSLNWQKEAGLRNPSSIEIEAGKHDPSYEERAVLSRAIGTPLPGVSGEVLDKSAGALVRMAESMLMEAGDDFLREIKKITKALKQVSSTPHYQSKISKADPKKLKSELLKMKKAIAEIESHAKEA